MRETARWRCLSFFSYHFAPPYTHSSQQVCCCHFLPPPSTPSLRSGRVSSIFFPFLLARCASYDFFACSELTCSAPSPPYSSPCHPESQYHFGPAALRAPHLINTMFNVSTTLDSLYNLLSASCQTSSLSFRVFVRHRDQF